MIATARRAGLMLFGVVAVAVVVWNLVPQAGPTAPAQPLASAIPSEIPAPTSAAEALATNARTREYAIALDELQGFPADALPGTHLELWVTWDRPSQRAPKLQRLISEAVLVRVIPPITAGGPTAVVVRVPIKRMPDLLWADGYGALSVGVVQ